MLSLSALANLRLARSGSSRSSRNRSTNSSRLRTNRNASSLSPSPAPDALPLPSPPPDRGRMSPSTNFLLPGSTMSRMPPWRWKRGSSIPSSGMLISPPSRTSLTSRSLDILLTASCTNAFARRRNLCRFSRLLLPGFKRLSTICMATFTSASAGLLHTHVPFDEPANLTLGVTALHHSRDELAVLLLGFAILLRSERDHRQQILNLREYPLLDHLADFFVA